MPDNLQRFTLGKMQNPVRGFLHGTAAVASVVGAVFLWQRSAGDPTRQIELLIFTLSMVGLYTTSSLYHSVPWRRVWKERMQRLDHAMIFVLVAGSYTPIACIALDGWPRVLALGACWGIAVAGILQKTLVPSLPHWVSIAMQIIQGLLALPLLGPLAQRLPAGALLLTILGGVFYTVGMLFFVTKRPRLWPRVFSYHEAFHVFVIAAAALHFSVIAAWVASYRG